MEDNVSFCSSEEYQEFDTVLDISERDSYDSYLSICFQENRLGLAYYRCGSFVFDLLHETYEYDDLSVLRAAVHKLQPSLVIVSSKIKYCLYKFLKEHSEKNVQQQNPSESVSSLNTENVLDEIQRFKFISLGQAEFDYERSKNKIISIPINENEMEDYQQRYIFLSSFIDFQEQTTIKAFGALLSTLEKELSFEESSQINSTRDKLCFTYFTTEFVAINRNSFEALEIFQEEWHPSISKSGFFKKEGVSLFGLFNVCQSKLGSFFLRKIFQQPTSDIEILLQRQSLIQYFLEMKDDILINIRDCLKGLKNITNSRKNFKSSIFRLSDFQLYSKNLDCLTQLRKYVYLLMPSFKRRFNYECKLFNDLFYSIPDETIYEMNHLIKLLINFDASSRTNKIQLMNGVDETLDELKQKFNSLPDLLRGKMIEDREVNPVTKAYFRQITYIYIPQMGFFIRMATDVSQAIPNLRNFGYEVMFCADKYTFFKNERMREFDREFGDLTSKILDRTNEVLVWLAETLCEDSNELLNCLYIAAEIDAILALSQAAKEFKLVRPVITASGTLKITQGRHLIHETINSHHVTNDYLSDDEKKINILYATNGAGKSVYIKQNALIVYMTHIGSFVPADSAEVPLIDQIFTRIKTLESISTQLSAFKADLNQLIVATKFAKKRSLVVIDTFGKGTLPKDALSLLVASINYWSDSPDLPHLMISSQFDLSDSSMIFKHPGKIRFLKFYFRDKQSTFRIRQIENEDEEDEHSSSIPVLSPEQNFLDPLETSVI